MEWSGGLHLVKFLAVYQIEICVLGRPDVMVGMKAAFVRCVVAPVWTKKLVHQMEICP